MRPYRTWMRVWACGMVLVTANCGIGDAPGGAPGVSVTDSAGVRIVVEDRDGYEPSAIVERIWQHGLEPEDYAFQFVLLGALREDGSAVVGDMANQEVVSIGSSGMEHVVLARRGQGPGEVAMPRSVVGAGGGEVWVEDFGNGKLLQFVGDSPVSEFDTKAIPAVSRGLMPVGVDVGARLLMVTAAYRPDFEEPWLFGTMARFDVASRAVDTVGRYPHARRPDPGASNPFSATGVIAGAGGGFVNAKTDEAQVAWSRADGAMTQIARWKQAPTYPTATTWTRFENSLRANLRRMNPQLSGEDLERFVDQQVSRYEVDASIPLPLFGQIHGAADGAVRLSTFSPGNTWPMRYRVMSSSGEFLGSMSFPRPFHVLDVVDDLVLGMVLDDFDVQAVALYRYRFGP